MKQNLLILKAACAAEIHAGNSRFISLLVPLSALDEVRERVSLVRTEHAGADHVVHAAVVGDSANVLQFSSGDDGEPRGTAGRPALEVLKGSHITNVVLMVVRYFGGTKLGTGGLVRAYADAARAVIAVARSEPLVHTRELRLDVGYDCYQGVRRAVLESGAVITAETFGQRAGLSARVRTDLVEAVVMAVRDASRGSAVIELD